MSNYRLIHQGYILPHNLYQKQVTFSKRDIDFFSKMNIPGIKYSIHPNRIDIAINRPKEVLVGKDWFKPRYYIIEKYEDDYYDVLECSLSNSQKAFYYHYKCDQWDGLMHYLKYNGLI